MYLLYRFFNSVLFMLVNLTIAMYTCRRFFGVMKSHYKLVAEVGHFNAIVRQSRLSLDYMNDKVSEAMKEIEGDIGKELYVTHNLTKISSKMALILKRFNALEEGVIELVRMDHNTESIKIETPTDINSEVKKIVKAARITKERGSSREDGSFFAAESPKTRKKSKTSTSTFLISSNDSTLQNPVSKFSAVKPTIRSKCDFPKMSISTISKVENVSYSSDSAAAAAAAAGGPTIVKLLSESRRHEGSTSKQPIGFRPSWKSDS